MHDIALIAATLTSPDPHSSFALSLGVRNVRKAAIVAGLALGLLFVLRATAEPFVIDLFDPATYAND